MGYATTNFLDRAYSLLETLQYQVAEKIILPTQIQSCLRSVLPEFGLEALYAKIDGWCDAFISLQEPVSLSMWCRVYEYPDRLDWPEALGREMKPTSYDCNKKTTRHGPLPPQIEVANQSVQPFSLS